MSGHSLNGQPISARRARRTRAVGKIFTKIIKEISVAARIGGGARIRIPACAQRSWRPSGNMPADNIKRAIQKGTGELPGSVIEEAVYEAMGRAESP